jgi:murein DD-endopeptidase MepM/ murein hydrolase activator NlpD
MSSSDRRRRAGLPSTHYFLSISRGDAIHTAVVGTRAFWSIVALLPLSLAFGLFGAADLALRAPLAVAAAAGRPAIEAADPDLQDSSPVRPFDTGRASDPNALEDRISALAARQESLEKRDAIVAALAAEATALPSPAGPRLDALGAIESLGPDRRREQAAGFLDEGTARAYAPVGAGSGPEAAAPSGGAVDDRARRAQRAGLQSSLSDPRQAPSYAAIAANSELEPSARLELLGRSLERVEGDEMTALDAIDRKASRALGRNAEILEKAGLDPEKLAAPKPLSMGGPFIPVDADPKAPAFDRAAAQAARDVSFAENLSALMPSVPLMMPLSGETSVSSPFGYRIDPFLGRPSLHPGVDLLQPYGAEIFATAAGRVIHAGPMGGYGDAVEIDHGHGLATVYGHMSEILVVAGQEVAKGDPIGRLGSTGRSTGPHLHYEVRVDGEPVDPERFIRAGAEMGAGEVRNVETDEARRAGLD